MGYVNWQIQNLKFRKTFDIISNMKCGFIHYTSHCSYGSSSVFACAHCAPMYRLLIKSSERFIALITRVLVFSPAVCCVRWCLVRAVDISERSITFVKGVQFLCVSVGLLLVHFVKSALVLENYMGSNTRTFHGYYLLRFIAYGHGLSYDGCSTVY